MCCHIVLSFSLKSSRGVIYMWSKIYVYVYIYGLKYMHMCIYMIKIYVHVYTGSLKYMYMCIHMA
jgi:hypothetical protein